MSTLWHYSPVKQFIMDTLKKLCCQGDAFLEKDACEKGRLVCLANNIELYSIRFVANYSIKLN